MTGASGTAASSHGPLDRAIKAASRALIHGCGGGEGAAATIAAAAQRSVRQQRMSDCGNAHCPDFLRIDEVGHLEDVAVRDAAWPPITRTLAARHGFVLVALPVTDGVAGDWLGGMGVLAKFAGDITSGIARALADDGVISADEAADILGEIDQAQAALGALRLLAEMRCHG